MFFAFWQPGSSRISCWAACWPNFASSSGRSFPRTAPRLQQFGFPRRFAIPYAEDSSPGGRLATQVNYYLAYWQTRVWPRAGRCATAAAGRDGMALIMSTFLDKWVLVVVSSSLAGRHPGGHIDGDTAAVRQMADRAASDGRLAGGASGRRSLESAIVALAVFVGLWGYARMHAHQAPGYSGGLVRPAVMGRRSADLAGGQTAVAVWSRRDSRSGRADGLPLATRQVSRLARSNRLAGEFAIDRSRNDLLGLIRNMWIGIGLLAAILAGLVYWLLITTEGVPWPTGGNAAI